MAGWYPPCWTSVLMICLTVNCSQGLTVTKTKSLDDVQKLLKAVEFHHDNYRKSLQELDTILGQLPGDQLKLLKTKTRISKRSEVNQLFNSFLAFCDNLKNEPEPESEHRPSWVSKKHYDKKRSNKTVDVLSNIKNKPGQESVLRHVSVLPRTWYEPNIPFRPVKLRYRSLIKWTLVVEITVTHRVPILAYTHLNYMLPVKPKNKKLLPNPQNKSKTSKVKFKINLQNCSKKLSQPMVQIQFAELVSHGSMFSINIKPCSGIGYGSEWKEHKLSFKDFKWTLPHNILINGSGRKTSFEVKLVNDTSIVLYITTLEFNKEFDKFTASLTLVNNQHDSTDECYLQKEIIDSFEFARNSSLVDIQLCSEESKKASDRDTAAESSTTIRIIANTSTKTESGLITISQEFRPQSENSTILMSSHHFISVIVADTQNSNPIPLGKMSFFGRTRFVCDTNPVSANQFDNFCGLECHVIGRDIFQLTILKKQADYSRIADTEFQSQVLEHLDVAHAFLKFNTIDAENEGDYICRVTSKTGHTEDKTLELVVAGLPQISKDDFTMFVRDDFAVITCKATGSDLNIAIYADEQRPENRLDTDTNNTLYVQRPTSNDVTYTLGVPEDRLKQQYVYTLLCVAANDVTNTTANIYVNSHTLLGDGYKPVNYTDYDYPLHHMTEMSYP